MRMCSDCQECPAVKGPRCDECNKTFRNEQSRRRRQRQKKKRLQDNANLIKQGKKVCSKCLKVRWLSEYSSSKKCVDGRLNDLCDECLTHIYGIRAFQDYPSLRKKAYLVNTVGRQRLARELGVSISDVKTKDLNYVCHPQDLAALLVSQSGQCAYCRVTVTQDNFSVDHVIPLSAGGGHDLNNLQVTCLDCNHLKHSRTHEEFIAFLRVFLKRMEPYAASA